MCRQRMSILFNEICINEEMQPTHTHTHTHTYIYIYIYIVKPPCAQLKQDTHVRCGLPTLLDITDITNSLAEPHFKASRRVIGEL